MPQPRSSALWLMRFMFWANRARFFWLKRNLKEQVEFGANCDIWTSNLILRGEGKVRFGPGCVVERGPFPFFLEVARNSRVHLERECWVRGKYRPNVLTCGEGAEIRIGECSILNGVIISALSSVTIGSRALLAWEVNILDSNLHPVSNAEPLQVQPITVGDHVWIGAGAMLLPGASIGSHSVIASHSVVTEPIPDHVLAAGSPAKVIRRIADRDQV